MENQKTTKETKRTTVKELIKQLLEFNQDAEISFQIGDGCCGDYDFLEGLDMDENSYVENGVKHYYINFRFDPLEVISSCIASGIAKRAVARHRSGRHNDPIIKANTVNEHEESLKEYFESVKKENEKTKED